MTREWPISSVQYRSIPSVATSETQFVAGERTCLGWRWTALSQYCSLLHTRQPSSLGSAMRQLVSDPRRALQATRSWYKSFSNFVSEND